MNPTGPTRQTGAPDSAVTWPDAARRAGFERWIAGVAPRHALEVGTLAPASADASFRRYLRVATAGGGTLIVMDAPPPLEDVRPFVKVAGLIAAAGLNAPRVLEADVERGFLLLTDLGRAGYLDALQNASPAEADRLMRDAVAALVRWQTAVPAGELPPFDEKLLRLELDLFADWCVPREFGLTWSAAERERWERLCRLLVDHALAQPRVAVHADWMPRNLMVADPNPGILDFQDAVRGPLAYDIVCLLRDAFVSWDEEREIDWAVRWWERARRAGLPVAGDFGAQWQAIEWMGLQRHLKVIGIFCRLKHRDGKPRYVADLPRFFAYAQKVALRYRPLAPLLDLLEPMSGAPLQTGYTF
jgi:aminoglycoside/choline kinase family phosphotransferase